MRILRILDSYYTVLRCVALRCLQEAFFFFYALGSEHAQFDIDQRVFSEANWTLNERRIIIKET